MTKSPAHTFFNRPNVLLKVVIEEFCARYAPGGSVLYVGDAAERCVVYDAESLAALGIAVDEHGKMPDLLVYRPDKEWLVAIEAVTSHGPMDAKRREELAGLLAGSTVPLVYVTALPDRVALRRYLSEIAWESEVWLADSPSHLIHFDGERYLGPYPAED